jgi:aconitate hydratase
MGNNISTDEILEAGAKALPFRSNIPEISKWTYAKIDGEFYKKALEAIKNYSGHIVVAGENYAQGSSREHAAMCPRYLGQMAVLAKSYARLGWQNLINFGIIPFVFENKNDYETIGINDIIHFENIIENLKLGKNNIAINKTKNIQYSLIHNLSRRQIKVILEGGMINYFNITQKHELN